MASDLGLAQVQKLTPKRRSALSKRLSECAGIEGWRAALEKVRGSSFLQGKSAKGWKIPFDFAISADGFAKLMEGAYDDRGQQREESWLDQLRADVPAPNNLEVIDGGTA